MYFISIHAIFILIGIVVVITTFFIPHQTHKKNILVSLQFLRQTVFFFSPGVAIFCISFYLTGSISKSIFLAFFPYILRYLLCFYQLKIQPLKSRRKWFYEIHHQNIMKTTETYPVKIILKPVIAELVYPEDRTKRLLQHISLSFKEKPITEKLMDDSRKKSTADAFSPLTVQVNGPAFQINPEKSTVLLKKEPVSVEFLITPSKSGKHLLAVEFCNESGQLGYLKTSIRVVDFIFLKFIRVTETQINVIRALGYTIIIIGVIVSILSTIGFI